MMRNVIIRGVSIVLFLFAWESIAKAYPDSFVVAGPVAIIGYIDAHQTLLGRALAATFSSAAWGFLWGNLAAVCMAILVILVPKSQRIMSALALVLFCLPLVATGPILRVLYGPGDGPQITLAALAVYYTTYLALLVGLRSIPQSWSDLNRIYGQGAISELIHIRAMASIPYLIAGLQIAAPAAFLGAMIGEFTGSERGIGVLILRAMLGLDAVATWTLAVMSASVTMVAYGLFSIIGRLLGFAPALLLNPPVARVSRSWITQLVSVTFVTVLVLLIWHIVMEAFELNPFFAKRPGDVWSYLFLSDKGPSARMTLADAITQTLTFALPGYFAGLILGAGLAALLILAPIFATTVLPVAVALRSVPIIATAPLIVLALGRGATGTIAIVAVMTFFPTLVACLQGLRQTPGQVNDVFNSYAAGRMRFLLWARIPVMLPAFFAAARMAVPAAVLAVTTTEWLATGKGIGHLMALTATTSNYNMLWSAIVALSIVAVAGYAAIAAIERVVLRIYASDQAIS